MILTPVEAKATLCPETFGKVRDPAETLCEASKCMAWRWVPPAEGEEPHTRGYCGYAGVPIE